MAPHDDDHGPIVDPQRSTCLCDAGAPDYVAAVCVTPDGEDVLWLVSKSELHAEHPRCGVAQQRHEQLGRLPQWIRERVWGELLRCGRPRGNGQPCRSRVLIPGRPCSFHSQGEAEP
jgi:hypothetical protein